MMTTAAAAGIWSTGWRAGAGVLLTAALLMGCTQSDNAAAPSASTTPAGTAPVGTVGSYEDVPCFSIEGIPETELSDAVTCGFLTVPEDRSDPAGPTIKIAVGRLAAEQPGPGQAPMVYLNGGPGSTSIPNADTLRAAGLNRVRDIIFVGQRGTLYAEPILSCPEKDAAQASTVRLPTLSAEAEQITIDAVQACHDRLVADGVRVAAFNTAENAADVADLRVALGIDAWHVYGVSYGTLLALTVVRDHPEGVISVALDSLVPPQDNLLTHGWTSAAGGYQAVFDACAAQPACSAAYPNLEDELTTTVTKLTAEPLLVDVAAEADQPAQQVAVDGYGLANVIVPMTAAPDQAALIPQMIHATATGDGQLAAAMLLAHVPPPGLLGYGLRYGVVCREFAPFTTIGEIEADGAQDLPGFPTAVLAVSPQFGSIMDECRVWDVPPADPAVGQPVSSALPVLLLAGTFDAITQPFLADSAATTLPNSRVIRFPGIGHDVVTASPCGREILADFLDRPDAYETTCVDSITIAPFTT